MTVNIIRYILLFVVLVLVQVLILNDIAFSGYINPFLYIYFLIALPFSTPRWASLLIGFGLGIIIDIFANTAGLHAFSATFLAYMRYHILNLLKPREGYDDNRHPSIRDMGFTWYLIYAALMVVIHHTIYFVIEMFRLSEFWLLLSRILLSSLITYLLVLLVQLLFGKQRSE